MIYDAHNHIKRSRLTGLFLTENHIYGDKLVAEMGERFGS